MLFLALLALAGPAAGEWVLHRFADGAECQLGVPGTVRIDRIVAGCNAAEGVNFAWDAARGDGVISLGCDTGCAACTGATGRVGVLGSCVSLDGPGEWGAVTLMPRADQCIGAPRAGRDAATAVAVTAFGGDNGDCALSGPGGAVITAYPALTDGGECTEVQVAGSSSYYRLQLDGGRYVGAVGCSDAQCVDCALAVNGSAGACEPVAGGGSVTVEPLSSLSRCSPPPPPPPVPVDPGTGNTTVEVVAASLGVLGGFWIVGVVTKEYFGRRRGERAALLG